eukprot:GEZU01012944.1.p1 GENE.GEZU01012944.1~~GEZU01012944.1.p1  ORF type:complete len:434 (-),score=71.43 GEZU01012944.1:111-1412(-)
MVTVASNSISITDVNLDRLEILPCLRIQHDWFDSFPARASEEDKFWVSCSSSSTSGAADLHGEIKVAKLASGEFRFTCSPGFEVLNHDAQAKAWIEIRCAQYRCTHRFYRPDRAFTGIHPTKNITCLGLSPSTELAISGSDNGVVRIWETSDGTMRRDLTGHFGDIYTCGFFPSGEVAYSAGADTLINIWRISDSLCAASLKGHRGAVLSISLIDRGRNFVASSRDCTAALWDCASQSRVATLVTASAAMNCVSVEKNTSLTTTPPSQEADPKEFATDGHIVACASEDGSLVVVDIRSRSKIFFGKHSEPLNTCLVLDGIVYGGTHDGYIFAYDLRNTSALYNAFRDSSAPILGLSPDTHKRIWAATNDGRCFMWNPSTTTTSTTATDNDTYCVELSGPNYDPVFAIAAYGARDHVFTTSRDGVIRKYRVAGL